MDTHKYEMEKYAEQEMTDPNAYNEWWYNLSDDKRSKLRSRCDEYSGQYDGFNTVSLAERIADEVDNELKNEDCRSSDDENSSYSLSFDLIDLINMLPENIAIALPGIWIGGSFIFLFLHLLGLF